MLEKSLNSNYLGGFLIAVVAALTSVSNSITHSLPLEISAFQILFLKTLLSCALLIIMNFSISTSMFKTSQFKWHFLKGMCGFLGSLFLIAALKMHKLSLSECSALSLSSAIITTIGAHVFFKEKINRFVAIAVLVGFIGVLLVLQPSWHKLNVDYLLPILSAIAFSASSLLAKKITLKDTITTTVGYLLIFMCILSAPLAIYFWIDMNSIIWTKITAMAIIYLIMQWCLIKAYCVATAGFIAPFKFVRFPFAIMLGLMFFGETPTLYSIGGASLIIISCVIIDGAKTMKSYAQQITVLSSK